MERLNLENVTAHFRELAHLTETDAETYAATVFAAAAYFGRILKRDPEPCEMTLCEYACACKAFYDYTVLKAATSKTYSTQSGGIYARLSDDKTVINAENLWQNALAALPHDLVRDCSFIFEGVAG